MPIASVSALLFPDRTALRAHALLAIALVGATLAARPVLAQDNYEIQVYGAETVPAGATMVELHSNYALSGRRVVEEGVFPTNHALHETLEITRGVNGWMEVGFYTFTSARSGEGWQWVGNHVRPRVRVPDDWHWPVRASLSFEVGYQRPEFSADTWTLEIRPIVDRQLGRWYVAFNPTLDRSLRGAGAASGFEFSPNAAVTADVTHVVNLGVEYYGALGPLGHIDPRAAQQHQLFGAVNLNVSPVWEINAGIGAGLTRPTDHRIVKLIVGRRFGP